jgi:hypothetical protein
MMQRPAIWRAPRRGTARSVLPWAALVLVGLFSCAVFSPAADAHVQKNRQGAYILGVDGWRQMQRGFVSKVNGDADTLTGLMNAMRDVIPPEDALEQALLENDKAVARQFAKVEADYGVTSVRETQKSANRWEKIVKPWFSKASDRRALENAMDAYVKGLTHLVHQSHGDLLDAAAALADADLDKANGHIALALGGVSFADQEMTDAVAALSKLR